MIIKMKKKEKFKVVLTEQPKQFLEDLVKKGDKKILKKFAKAIDEISEDPTVGTPVICDYDENILNELRKLEGKKINEFAVWEGSLFENGADIDLKVDNQLMDLYGVSILYNGSKVETAYLGKNIKKGIFVGSCVYNHNNNQYEIKLSKEKSDDPFLIKAKAISINVR